MKEVSSLMKESVWLDDKGINDCQGCKKPFSVSRRKVNIHTCKTGVLRHCFGGWVHVQFFVNAVIDMLCFVRVPGLFISVQCDHILR